MLPSQKVKLLVRILRKRLPTLGALEATYIAYQIVEALDKADSKSQVNEPTQS